MNTEGYRIKNAVEEKTLTPMPGLLVLFLILAGFAASVALIVNAGIRLEANEGGVWMLILGIVGITLFPLLSSGFHIVNPNEAKVLVFFGQYLGTIKKPGFYYVKPFASSMAPFDSKTDIPSVDVPNTNTGEIKVNVGRRKAVSLKTMTLNNKKQKVNDSLGNPIIIGAVVIWRVVNPTAAVFNVENYGSYLSIQCDSTIRNIARLYPYDTITDEPDTDEQTLRGSSIEIAAKMQTELQQRVSDAGLEVMEVRITHLSYSEEIAQAMLQRQQAVAVIAARQKIVEGAVGMVQMAVRDINEDELIVLDDERIATMVSNLLVVLCSNKDIQPVVNSGSIY